VRDLVVRRSQFAIFLSVFANHELNLNNFVTMFWQLNRKSKKGEFGISG
jgi:hypothetical protein